MKFNYSYTKWILLAITVIAGIIRCFILDVISLDTEEQKIWFCGIQYTPFDSLLFFLEIKPFSLILSITAWLTCWDGVFIEILNRSISVLAGVLCVPLIFILARKFYSEVEGLISAGFISFSWICISVSLNMAEHSLLVMNILLYFIALITMLDSISEEGIVSKQENNFFILTGILLGFTSIWGMLIVFVSFLYIFFFIKKLNIFLRTLARFSCIIIPISLFCFWGLKQDIYSLNNYVFLDYITFISDAISSNYFISIVLISPIFYLIFVYIRKLFSKEEFGEDAKTKFNNSTLLVAIWLLGSILGFVLLACLLKISFSLSDLVFVIPPLFILISRSIVLISARIKHQIIISSTFGLLFLLSVFLNLDNINNKPEYDQASRFLMRDKNNFVIIVSKDNNFPKEAKTYYLNKNNIKKPIFQIENIDKTLKEISKQNVDYIWFIADNDADKEIISELYKKKLITGGYRYKGITIYKL
ncbi:MAG: hypothetical protein FWG85_02305 [Bacteroidetes bacterium]|nr:hypothetical protein [Bacteroidota bacterium]